MDELFLKKSQYRADIDGLRALAVISVVLYHFFPEILPGGFIGVDVFFVISGYLISLIIFSNIKKGTFSYKEFYTRRILRIFPSLCLVLIFTLSIGWFILDNNDYTVLGNEVIAGVLFLSNFNFASQAGYFDAVSISKPLLHLWSLGVEEQFYIFWPLIIVVLWNSRTNLLWVTFFILFTSFLFNILNVDIDPTMVFYSPFSPFSPFSRFWELMMGGGIGLFSTLLRQFYSRV